VNVRPDRLVLEVGVHPGERARHGAIEYSAGAAAMNAVEDVVLRNPDFQSWHTQIASRIGHVR
jgi:hypothetical protein